MNEAIKKKRIIYFSTPAYGHLMPEFPIIKELVNLGYEVEWYCSAKYKEFAEKSGAKFIAYDIDFDNMYNVAELTENFYNLMKGLISLNQQAYSMYIQNNYDDVDLIIYDSMAGFGKNLAQKFKIKSVCLSALVGYNPLVFTFSNMLFPSIKLFLCHGIDIMKLVKQEKKFRKENNIARFSLLDLFVNKGDITIVFMPNELQPFVTTFPKDVKFVGTTIKDRLNFKEETYNEDYDIYVSFGSVFTNNIEVINAIVNEKFFDDKKILINIGSMDLKSPKENITYIHYTNQVELLKHCKLFINQGGLNSIYESIYNKVVQISIPLQEEQRMNAKIVAKKKLGFYLKKFDINKIKKYINKIDSDKKYQESIEKYSKIVKEYDGTKLAIEHITKLLEE
ncbi:MAG: hypothetical protein IKP28_03390 [Clostridia bacterium]|nr:hypothetical protein [Clostridia bacterium]